MPKHHFSWPALTPSSWRATAKRFKSACGAWPRWFAREDVVHMPDSHLDQFLSLLHHIEHDDLQWPQQLSFATVIGLAKVDGAHEEGQFRPINLFSSLYRNWARMRAKQMLQQMSHVMPVEALGFIQHRETTEMWLQLQAHIELMLQRGEAFAGLSTDLKRAFNNIGRKQVFIVAQHLGLPWQLLNAWQKFLSTLWDVLMYMATSAVLFCHHQVFQRDALFLSLRCWLSTGAIMYTCVSTHRRWQLFSFVHNLLLCTAWDLSAFWLEHWWWQDLRLGAYKNWSTANGPASFFLVSQMQVNLGGYDIWCRQAQSHFASSRCQIAIEMDQIETITGPYAAEICHASDGFLAIGAPWCFRLPHFWQLCLGVTTCRDQGIGHQWGRLQTNVEAFTLRQHVQWPRLFPASALCLCYEKDAAESSWPFAYVEDFLGKTVPGPFSRLLECLSGIGWAIVDPPLIQDHEGHVWDLIKLDNKTLTVQLRDGWLQYVASQTKHKTIHGLHGIDGQLTLLDTANMLPLERARLSALHSGAFISSYEHAKYDEEKIPFCTICGLADDCEHWLHCPRFAHIRDSIPDWMPDNVELPKCMLNHLLVPRIPQLVQWLSLLCNLKYGTQTFQFPPPKFGFHHLFGDGSCTVEAYPDLQLASWGVINATAGLVVSAAHLHGPTRTIDRAELSAVISALLWGAHAELACARGLTLCLRFRWQSASNNGEMFRMGLPTLNFGASSIKRYKIALVFTQHFAGYLRMCPKSRPKTALKSGWFTGMDLWTS